MWMAINSAKGSLQDQVSLVVMVMHYFNRTPLFLSGWRKSRSASKRKISSKTSTNSDTAEVVDPINPHSEKPLDLFEEPALRPVPPGVDVNSGLHRFAAG